MTQHKQVPILLDDRTIYVDEGLERIIEALNHWGFSTNNSCRDNFGRVWISFNDFYEVEQFYQYALKRDTEEFKFIEGVNTLFEYLMEIVITEIVFNQECVFDPNEEDTVIGTGRLEHSVSLRFPKEDLEVFEAWILDLLPVET